MKIAQFFNDDTGQLSSMRLIFILWGVGVFGVWGAVSIMTKTLSAIPIGAVEIMGMCLASKVVQSFAEK